MPKRKRPLLNKRTLLIGAGLLGAAAAVIGGLAVFWTEYLWFKQLDLGQVYATILLSRWVSGLVFGVIALGVLGIHVVLIRRFSKPRADWTIMTPEGDIDLREIVSKVTTPVVVTAAVIVAAVMGYWGSTHWEEILRYINAVPFGEKDPILGKDIGFYLFHLPVLQFVQEWFVYLFGASVVFIALVYFGRHAIVVRGNLPDMTKQVRGHLLFGLACVAFTIALGYWLEMFETLFSKRGIAYGATYTDVYANLVAYRVLIAAFVVCGAYLLIAIRLYQGGKKAVLHPAYALASVVVLYGLGVFVWPTIVQKVVVNPNELDKERPYLEHAITGTRRAYQLDKIQVKEFPATENLTLDRVEANQATIDNVKIWDHRPLRETYRQLQVIRLYYDFPNISVDRYHVGDGYRQVMLSAREFVPWNLPQQSRTWVNQHLLYTHGYGACLSPVNQSSNEGLPDFWLKDIPPEARHPELAITRPEIYYGLVPDDYVLVKTTTQEFDYPKGEENHYTTYQGKSGVNVGSFLRRLLFAIRFGDLNLLFTEHLAAETRILFNRSIQERALTAAPFLMLDQEPYITVVDGRMFWIQDAYTVSYRYPYSQPTALGKRERINYIRNAAKVVTDAFDGSMSFYLWDDQDPMIQTYVKAFPTLFKKRSEMPAKLREHVRYPKDLFTVQAAMYESFHMTDPRVFYNQEDKWSIARELDEKTSGRPRGSTPGVTAERVTSQNRMEPYYMIMKLPHETEEEFLLMVPYTPTSKDNMVAWMTARCDDPNYGKLLVYTFPKKKMVFGPMQIEARIDQDDYISQWITLRNQQGSTVIRGDLLVIPIEESILYVEPVYLQSTETQLPELKQVIVAFGQRLAMRERLEDALADVFRSRGGGGEGRGMTKPRQSGAEARPMSAPAGRELGSVAEIAKEALNHYRAAEDKLSKSDWSGYGDEQKALRKSLERLSNALAPSLTTPKRAGQGTTAPAAPQSAHP